jgi:putative hydrolase of the HAD superfamily
MIICNRLAEFSEYDAKQIYKLVFDSGLEQKYDEGKITSEEFYLEMVKLLNININYEQFAPLWADIFNEIPEVSNIILDLKNKGYKVYLLSNTNELHFEHCKNNYPILREFNEYILSYNLGYRKPDPRIYLKALEISGQPANRHIFIDDKEENVKAAESVGMLGIHYKSFEQFKNALSLLEILP